MAVSTNADDLAREVGLLQAELRGVRGLVSGWSGSGLTTPRFDHIQANSGDFDVPPLEFSRFRRFASTQNLPTGQQTAIQWDRGKDDDRFGTGLMSWSSVTNTTRIYFPPTVSGQQQGFLVDLWAVVLGTSGGTRFIEMEFFRSDDSSIGALRFDDQLGSSLVGNPLQGSIMLRVNSSFNYLTVRIWQNSGTTVDLEQAYLSFMRVS